VRLPRPTRTAAAVLAVPVALALAACGDEGEPDVVNGKTLFVQKCGSCHVLKRANTQGVQGPSLDEAFDAARRDGMSNETVEGVTRQQIANVRRNSIMPPNLVVGDDARDVAAYVGEAAGMPGEDKGPLAQAGKPKTSNKPIRASGGQLKIDADPTGALAFVSTRAIAPAGSVTLVMGNKSSVQHNIAVKNGSDEKGPVVGRGGTSRVSTSLKKGEYTFYCSVPGHEAGGMKGELTVE